MSLLLLISLFINAGLFVLIWIVQTLIYPGFHHIAAETFREYHQSYSQRMGYIAGPLMIAQLGSAGYILATNPSAVLSLLHFAAIGITWISTFSLSVPLHKKLQTCGKDPAMIKKLVATNWIRTLTWTFTFGAALLRASGL